MTRKRGNPNWGRPIAHALVLVTEFELRARQLHLTPETYASSAQLRTWCQQNRNRVYVPDWLLEVWCLAVDPTLKRRTPRLPSPVAIPFGDSSRAPPCEIEFGLGM